MEPTKKIKKDIDKEIKRKSRSGTAVAHRDDGSCVV